MAANPKDQIASMVRFHRKTSGLARKELADLAGVGKTVIYDIEHGKSTIRLDSLLKLLNALNIKIQFESPLMKQFQELQDEKG